MDLSRLRTRRGVIGLALAAALAKVAPVRAAQTTAGCDIGFTYGLLTIGGEDCGLLAPPGMQGANVSLPGHMVDAMGSGTTAGGTSSSQEISTLTASSTSTTSPQAERQARLQKRRDKKRRKRGRKTDQKQTKNTRRGTKRRARREEQEEADRLASLKRCSDFSNQKQALEYMAQFGDEEKFLDPDRDKMPCEDLKAVTCNQIRTEEGAGTATEEEREEAVQSWLKRHGFTTSNNHYGFKITDGVLCPAPVPEDDETETTTTAQFVNG